MSGNWDVEKIVAHKIVRELRKEGNKWIGGNEEEMRFRVRWEGYAAGQDTWEPMANLTNNEALISYCQKNELNPVTGRPLYIRIPLQRARDSNSPARRSSRGTPKLPSPARSEPPARASSRKRTSGIADNAQTPARKSSRRSQPGNTGTTDDVRQRLEIYKLKLECRNLENKLGLPHRFDLD